ncbi:MAG: deoxyribonuclease IV [Acidobacteria bacterium]|nr:deoxyribonuclease IV [Acidobacteriota bacterium]MBI3658241.1 deoxyribonuclease IV [Acidobacteriota bacterium]
MSIAGGVSQALLRGASIDCATIQLFTKSNMQWKAFPLSESEVTAFHAVRHETGITPIVAHSSYLLNLASPHTELFAKSVESAWIELERCERLGIEYFVIHPGAAMTATPQEGVRRVGEALDGLHARLPGYQVQICLETSAGQGTCVGHRFDQLAQIISSVKAPERVGICVDTCHIYAAGYDISTRAGYEDTISALAETVGLDRIKVFHLNDSKKGLGCRVDRHEHIGRGCLGLDPFRFLMNDRRFAQIPKILETPKDEKTLAEDRINLATLRSLYHGGS